MFFVHKIYCKTSLIKLIIKKKIINKLQSNQVNTDKEGNIKDVFDNYSEYIQDEEILELLSYYNISRKDAEK